VQPLLGTVVVDFSWYLPGPFATRELLRLGARVVRVEPPEGDPLRSLAPGIDALLNAGKESVRVDLKAEPEVGRVLVADADVVVDGFRPGVLDRLLGEEWLPERTVLCSITGFGRTGPRAQQVGHDLNYLGYAGVLADTAPAVPPVQPADLAAGSLAAALAIVAALLDRGRTGRGARLDVSMTHGSHDLVAHRLGGEPVPRMLTGGLACYRIYATADGRWLTVGALEPRFFARLCELLGLDELPPRQYDADAQDELAARLAARIAERPLADWLALLDGEEVCAGPVLSLEEAAAELGR
jgi:crotonobetainyl-CoA:carnitine CoA-transferase CaiB-like acyl-CoA transferase